MEGNRPGCPVGSDRPSPDLGQRWALVSPHREHLLAVARRRCANPEDAEDCVHEALLKTVAYPGLDPSRTAALLTAMVTRACADLARQRSTEHRGRPRLVTLPEQVAGPEEAVTDRAEAHWLAEQIEHLPEREGQVLRRRVAGLTVPETATSLQLSYKAVESALARARGRLRLLASAP